MSAVPTGPHDPDQPVEDAVQEAVDGSETLQEAATRIGEVRAIGEARPKRTGPDGEPLGGDAG